MLIEGRGLKKYFKGGLVKAVDGVSISIPTHTTVGLVGESGCGKSTLARLLLRLLPPDSGEILWSGRAMGAVFQNPYQSLNPRMRVEEILSEPFLVDGKKEKTFLKFKAVELLKRVGLPPDFLSRYSYSLSGGECQRVAIARAIAREPELIVCDEPVSSLDVITQVQILNLFLELQQTLGVSYLFISHDLAVVQHMSDKVFEMKEGRMVDFA